MMVMQAMTVLILVLVCLMSSSCGHSQSAPERRIEGVVLPLQTLWSRATFVATGNLKQARHQGRDFESAGSPTGRIFLCESEIIPSVLIKGPANDSVWRVEWFSFFPSCTFEHVADNDPKYVDRLWFLRSDGATLRPVADDAVAFLGLYERFTPRGLSASEVRVELAEFLLRREALTHDQNSNYNGFGWYFPLACELAGDLACRAMVVAFQDRAVPKIRAEVCQYLWISYDLCDISECSLDEIEPAAVRSEDVKELKAKRKRSALAQLSEAVSFGVMSSGDSPKIAEFRSKVRRLVCHYDSEVRLRARKVALKYFPSDGIAERCPRCK